MYIVANNKVDCVLYLVVMIVLIHDVDLLLSNGLPLCQYKLLSAPANDKLVVIIYNTLLL